MWCHTSEDWGNCGPDCTTSSGTPSSSTPMSISGKYLQLIEVTGCLILKRKILNGSEGLKVQ